MAYPLNGTERARPDIAETFLEMDLAMNIGKMVGTQVLPMRNVTYAHGVYPTVELKVLMGNPLSATNATAGFAARREPRSAYLRDELPFKDAPYRTLEHGLEGIVDENERAHYASSLDHEATTALWTRHRLLVQQEKRVASQVFSTTTFGTGQNAAASVNWKTSPSTADPIGDFNNAKEAIVNKFAMWPDCIVMNRLAWQWLRETNQIRERIHAQGAGDRDRARLISTSQVAQIFDVDEIIVADAMEDANTANQAAFSGQHIWGPHACIFKKVRGTSIREIGLGHTLHWAADRSMPNGYVEDYREPRNRGNIIRVRHQTQELIKYPIGFLVTDVYTP